jgi:hypothetical protein
VTIGIMQPYFFPYVGYFQLISSVDTFVLYDDVNFIKQGWINRNRILLENREFLFTLPLNDPSSFKLINEVGLNERNTKWREKFCKTIESAYRKAPYFELVYEMIRSIVGAEHKTIADLAASSICVTSEYLNIKTKFITSSKRGYDNTNLKSQERVIDICQKENALKYINPMGGADLYSKEDFLEKKLSLHFLKTIPINYKQFNNLFVPNLSMIDVLMFNSVDSIQGFLERYELL